MVERWFRLSVTGLTSSVGSAAKVRCMTKPVGSTGGQLDIVVAATLDHAEQLLKWIRESRDQSRRVRIWCLATLAARDYQAKYRSVQQQYPPGTHVPVPILFACSGSENEV
jgi:hypothetical protein